MVLLQQHCPELYTFRYYKPSMDMQGMNISNTNKNYRFARSLHNLKVYCHDITLVSLDTSHVSQSHIVHYTKGHSDNSCCFIWLWLASIWKDGVFGHSHHHISTNNCLQAFLNLKMNAKEINYCLE
jgi:hypothetical protein